MHWNSQPIRCSRAVVMRGYRKGSYEAQSPYQALMLVLTHRGRHQVQGLLSQDRLKKSDIAKLRKACAKHGIRVGVTRRHGRLVTLGENFR